MATNSDNAIPISNTETTKVAGSESVANSQENNNFKHTQIHGRWDQYRSPFWSLAIAAVGMRYFARPFTRQWWNPEEKLKKAHHDLVIGDYLERHPKRQAEIDAENPDIVSGRLPKGAYSKKYAYAGVAGAILTGITSYYTLQTYKDMKNLFAETVGWETGKKPEDVNVIDLIKSKNVIVHRTMENFRKRTLKRAAIDSIFFLPFIPKLGPALFKKGGWIEKTLKATEFHHAETPLDLGVAGTSAYLLSDVVGRKISFFEELQNFTDRKINHTDTIGDKITPEDLISLYNRHARDSNPKYTFSGHMDTPQWRGYQVLFGRVAELMNETYGNSVNTEQADFTIPKLIYLLGQGLIRPEMMEQSLAVIEVASKKDGIPATKKLVTLINQGVSFDDISARFPELSSACQTARTTYANAVEKETALAVRSSSPSIGKPITVQVENDMAVEDNQELADSIPARKFANDDLKKSSLLSSSPSTSMVENLKNKAANKNTGIQHSA